MTRKAAPYHVEFMRKELEKRRSKNPRYSLRAFAMMLKLHPSALSRILNCNQELSVPSALAVLNKLELTREEKRLFLASVAEEKRFRAANLLAKAIDFNDDEIAAPQYAQDFDTDRLNPKDILAFSPYLTCVIDREGRYLYSSNTRAHAVGPLPHDLVGKTLRDLNLAEELIQNMEAQQERMFSAGESSEIEMAYENSWFERSLTPLRDENGQIHGAISVIHDITERKRLQIAAETALLSEKQARQAAEVHALRAEKLLKVSSLLAMAITPEDVARTVLSQVMLDIGASGGVVYVLSGDGSALEILNTSNTKTMDRRAQVGIFEDLPVAVAARSATPVWCENIEDRLLSHRDLYTGELDTGVKWVTALPLVIENRVIGVAGFRFAHQQEFDEDQKTFLLTLAVQCGEALDRALNTKKHEKSAALINTLFKNAPIGVAFVNRHLEIETANDEAARIAGRPMAELIGHSPARLCPQQFWNKQEDIESRYLKVLRTGHPILNLEHAAAEDSARDSRVLLDSLYPVKSPRGEILGVGIISSEVTEKRKRELQRERGRDLLVEAGRLIGSTLDPKETLKQLTNLIVPEVADLCSVALLREHGNIEIVEMTHTNPEHEKAGKDLIRLQQMRIEDTRGPGLCIRTGQAELISHVQDAHFIEYSRNPETLEALRRQAAKSLMTVPIRCGERVIGALTLVSTESKRTFSAEDLHLAIELAERTGLALRNSREAGLPEARSL